MANYTIGIDYGTASVRAAVFDVATGEQLGAHVFAYPRFAAGDYCDAAAKQFRQHPLDYLEGLEASVVGALDACPAGTREQVVGLSVDTTGSTPVAVDASGTPLALLDAFADDPEAMFYLWKDHTSIAEADELNAHNARHVAAGGEDHLRFVGGIYSTEWFWAKLLHALRQRGPDSAFAKTCHTWVEHCDWMPFVLTGGTDASRIRRGVCAAGHKGLFADAWGGYPPPAYFGGLDNRLAGFAERLPGTAATAAESAGTLCAEWAEKFGLGTDVQVGIGALDAHIGAVGGQTRPRYLTKVMGTSTCDMIAVPPAELGDTLVPGISGQVPGSIVPGKVGLEAGQSAFGDVFAWFEGLLSWGLDGGEREGTLRALGEAAARPAATRGRRPHRRGVAQRPPLARRQPPRPRRPPRAHPSAPTPPGCTAPSWRRPASGRAPSTSASGTAASRSRGSSGWVAWRRSRPSSCRPSPTCSRCRSRCTARSRPAPPAPPCAPPWWRGPTRASRRRWPPWGRASPPPTSPMPSGRPCTTPATRATGRWRRPSRRRARKAYIPSVRTILSLSLALLLPALSWAQPGVVVPAEAPRDFAEASRQVHLDFHTSEYIDSIGVDFSREQFRAMLRRGNVNAINVFAKGHHSWFYYPTEVGRQHPNLHFDLLGEMIAACEAEDVRVYAYFTVGWSANDALNHPEWVGLRRDGTSEFAAAAAEVGGGEHPGGWAYLEPSGPYADTILAQVEELVTRYPDLDGVWFDIFKAHRPNFNAWSLADYAERSIDTADYDAVYRRALERYHDFTRRANAVVAEHLPDGTTFYNGTTATYFDKDLALFKDTLFAANAKHDLEDLPTAWGGYDIFPWRSKYFANTGKPTVAMSGKFHKAWGEFGGFKDPEAIRYEAANMVAFGAACNFGDQLHPRGEMDSATYANIGHAYDYVRRIENYGVGAAHVARTGLYTTESLAAVNGVTQMLLEEQVNFNVVNTLADWSDVEVLILPSGGILPAHRARVEAFVARGGKVLTLGDGFLLDGEPVVDVGADYLGPAEYDNDYTVVGEALATDMVSSPYLNYEAGLRLAPKPGARVLAGVREPYFSRSLERYSSHANTPYRPTAAAHPAAVERADGRVIAIAHDLDRQYAAEGMRLHRQLFANALARLRDDPLVTAEMPSMGRLNLLHQPDDRRYVAHLTYASPIQRGNVRVVEDIVPLHDVAVSVSLPVEVTRAYLVPAMREVTLVPDGDRLAVTLDELDMHAALVLEY